MEEAEEDMELVMLVLCLKPLIFTLTLTPCCAVSPTLTHVASFISLTTILIHHPHSPPSFITHIIYHPHSPPSLTTPSSSGDE